MVCCKPVNQWSISLQISIFLYKYSPFIYIQISIAAYIFQILRHYHWSLSLTPAFSTPATWCHVFHSRVFHPCHLVPRFPLPRFPPLLSRATFSTPAFSTPAFLFFDRATFSTPPFSVAPYRPCMPCALVDSCLSVSVVCINAHLLPVAFMNLYDIFIRFFLVSYTHYTLNMLHFSGLLIVHYCCSVLCVHLLFTFHSHVCCLCACYMP